MNIMNLYVYENRNMSNDLSRPLMLENLNVDTVKVHIPKEIDGTDMGTWAWWFVYLNAKKEKYSIPMTLELTTNDEEEEEYTSDVSMDHGFTGKHGQVSYAIEAIQADGSGTITGEWHTKTYKEEIVYTLQGNQTEYDESESDIISALISRVNELIQSGAEIAEIAETIENAAETAQEAIDSIPADYSELSNRVGANTIALAEKADQATTYTKTEVDQMIEDVEVETDTTLAVSGAPADSAETGRQIGLLKADLGDIRTASGINLFNPDALIPNTFLDSTTGEATENNNYWATDYIAVSGVYTARPFEYSGTARIRIYLYDANKSYLSRQVTDPANYPRGYTFTWTGYVRINIDNGNNAAYEDPNKYLLIKGLNTDNVAVNFIPYYTAYDRTARSNYNMISSRSLQYADATGITNANNITDIRYYYLTSSAVENLPYTGAGYLWCIKLNNSNILQLAYDARANSAYMRAKVVNTWGSWQPIGKNDLNSLYETSTISLFPSVGCCGDSFTAGYLYNKEDSQYYDPDYVPNGEYPAIGYPAVMGRLYGVDVTAYAKGGLTSTAYRTDAKGLPALLADTPKYLYIIALGLNDKTQNVPIGVEADIDTEPSTPTYLGNMGHIIRQIETHAPYARIILCKSLWMNNDYYNYISSGVELLSSHLGIPYIETKGDAYFESDYYKNGLKGLHPTAPLYAGIGKRMGELVGKCVIENPQYFYNFYVPNN